MNNYIGCSHLANVYAVLKCSLHGSSKGLSFYFSCNKHQCYSLLHLFLFLKPLMIVGS